MSALAKGWPGIEQCKCLPYGLVSLWDVMINFRLFSVVKLILALQDHQRTLGQPPRNSGDVIAGGDLIAAQSMLEWCRATAQDIESLELLNRVNRFSSKIAVPITLTLGEAAIEYRILIECIEHAMHSVHLYHYPLGRAELLKRFNNEWESVIKAFPDSEKEALAAVDCYALDQATASVFHSMRVAEHGLRSLARERRIRLKNGKPIEWATWQEIISALEKEATAIGNKRAGPPKDRALEFYRGALADLNGFKDEYRNMVMHVRAVYDDLQALRALTKVREFMMRISEKIDHRHHRIRWGF